MKMKLYMDDVLVEECTEEGFIIFCATKDMSILELFGLGHKFPCREKKYDLPNGNFYSIKLTTSPVFQEVFDIMNQFQGLKFLELQNENAKLQVIL